MTTVVLEPFSVSPQDGISRTLKISISSSVTVVCLIHRRSTSEGKGSFNGYERRGGGMGAQGRYSALLVKGSSLLRRGS